MVTEKNQEISYLDLLLLMAENFKLLLFAPTVVVLLVIFSGLLSPQTFTSESVFSVTGPGSPLALERMESQLILDRAASTFPPFNGLSKLQARNKTKEYLKFDIGKDKLLTLRVTTDDPKQSQNLSNAVFEEWKRSDIVGDLARAELEQRLTYAKAGLDAVSIAIDSIKSSGRVTAHNNIYLNNSAALLEPMSEMQIRYLSDLLSIYKELQGVSRLEVLQTSTLPVEPDARGRFSLALRTYFLVFIALMSILLIRRMWHDSSKIPLNAKKQALIKSAIGLR